MANELLNYKVLSTWCTLPSYTAVQCHCMHSEV